VLRQLMCLSAGIAFLATATVAGSPGVAAQDVKQIRWATSSVGSSGHRALVALATLLNREMPEYEITVLPTPGAAASVRGFSAGQFDGYYGADVAYHEIANRSGRYRDFDPEAGTQLLQSFWSFTLEIGLGISAADKEQFSQWRDLSGKPVFTGPAPWDTRATLERAMQALEVGHEYIELDTGLAGSALQEGQIEAFSVYTTGGSTPAPWVTEAMLTTEVAVLNPSEEEIAELRDAGIDTVRVPASAFESDVGVEEAVLIPLFYGFHVGLDIPEDDVYRMLTIIEENADELAEADSGYGQLAAGMVELQRRGIQASPDAIAIHPGLARFLKERDAWDEAWDDRVAS
jgi:TRAP transporter TAXI family solute receptor